MVCGTSRSNPKQRLGDCTTSKPIYSPLPPRQSPRINSSHADFSDSPNRLSIPFRWNACVLESNCLSCLTCLSSPA